MGTANDGREMHYSVGALIERKGKVLLIDRVKPPYGFAGLAGHVDGGETDVEALLREVGEESGLTVSAYKLVAEEEVPWNWCSKGVQVHYWKLFACTVSGRVKRDAHEAKRIEWFSYAQIRKLQLEPVWEYWLKKMGKL